MLTKPIQATSLTGCVPGDGCKKFPTLAAAAAACAMAGHTCGGVIRVGPKQFEIRVGLSLVKSTHHETSFLKRCISIGGVHRGWLPNFLDQMKMSSGKKEQSWQKDQSNAIFQLDGILGAVNGILEMLVQSHIVLNQGLLRVGQRLRSAKRKSCDSQSATVRVVELLPALPPLAMWREGSVSGVRARGGLSISMEWRQWDLEWAVLRVSTATARLRLRMPVPKGAVSEAKPILFSRPATNTTQSGGWTPFPSVWVKTDVSPGSDAWMIEVTCLHADVQYLLMPATSIGRCGGDGGVDKDLHSREPRLEI